VVCRLRGPAISLPLAAIIAGVWLAGPYAPTALRCRIPAHLSDCHDYRRCVEQMDDAIHLRCDELVRLPFAADPTV
jgi:hypothetical protein